MPASDFLEDASSQLPALLLLEQLGYAYLTPAETKAHRGGRLGRVVLEDVLLAKLRELNQISFRGETHEFSEQAFNNAVRALVDLPIGGGLVKANEQAYDLLVLGKSEEQTIDGNKRSHPIRYIDWETPENNIFHVSDEFEVERAGSHKTRRPDLVLFVNGIPLAVIECKRPDQKDPLAEAISQNLRNQRQDEIPGLFVYAQLLLAVCQSGGMYGATGTPKKFWSKWREENAPDLPATLAKLVNTPTPPEMLERIYSSRPDWVAERLKQVVAAGQRMPSPQDELIYCLLRPERLLELTQRFVVFDKGVKKVPRYQQYFAIRETMARVARAKGDSKRDGGVIWHTTGSGKSITMVLLAKALSLAPGIKNPRVVIVTDRVDLDRQIWETFRYCGKKAERAQSGEHLVRLVKDGKADVITTIIDKFESAATRHELRDESNNVFVLVDESHRSQYGLAHAKMKQTFPNACYIGFTGTPLLKVEKSTATKFGGFIHSYPMRAAIADKAVAPILYEGRMAALQEDAEKIDRWFERITADLTDEQKVDLKKRFAREEELTKSDERLYEIAFDIASHYCETFKRAEHGEKKKGQLAVSSKTMALRYHRLFAEIGEAFPNKKVSTRVVISPPDTREDNETIEEEDIPEIQKFWKELMQEHGSERKYLEATIDAFNGPGGPEILICVDKLLTGFDAPRNSVLYVDKRLREHNLLQAIARVNRLFEGKDYGLVIDYRGIFGALDQAVKAYDALSGFDQEDIEGTFTDLSEVLSELPEKHTNVWAVFGGVNRQDTVAMQEHLRPEDVRQDFYDALNEFAKTLQLAMSSARFHESTPKETISRYVDDLKYFRSLRSAVRNIHNETIDYREYEDQIRSMVAKYVGAEEVERIIEPVDIFAVENLDEELSEIDGDAAKADFIASRVKKTCTEKMDEDPILYQRLSQVIKDAIDEYTAGRITEQEYLQRTLAAWNDAKEGGESGVPSELRADPEAQAYFRWLLEKLGAAACEGRDDLAAIAAETALKVKEKIDAEKIRDWTTNSDVENRMLNALDDLLYAVKGRTGLPLSTEAIDEILEGLIRIAKRREVS